MSRLSRRDFLKATGAVATISGLSAHVIAQESVTTPQKTLQTLPKIPTRLETAAIIRKNQSDYHQMIGEDDRPTTRAFQVLIEEIAATSISQLIAHDLVGIIPMTGPTLKDFPGVKFVDPDDVNIPRTHLRQDLSAGTKQRRTDFEGIHDLISLSPPNDSPHRVYWHNTRPIISRLNDYSQEVDREILVDLRNNTAKITKWKFDTNKGNTIKEWFMPLLKIVNDYPATWIVTSPELDAILRLCDNEYQYRIERPKVPPMSLRKTGEVNGKDIYVDPLFPIDSILLGTKKGDHVGYYYNPFIPIATHCGNTYDRYSKTLVDSTMYHTIKVDHFSHANDLYDNDDFT